MEIPHYNTWLPCTHVDNTRGVALVKSFRTGKSFPVKLKPEIKYLVCRGDRLHVIKSHVSREWLAIDYTCMTSNRVGEEEC